MINILGTKEYYGYYILETSIGNFLKLDNIPITPYLIDTYIGNDLSKFIPRTNVETMKKFENNLFLELEKSYFIFIQKSC